MNVLWAAVIGFLTSWYVPSSQIADLNAPVTALAVVGDRLLIGQNARLVDAVITPDALTVSRTIDLAHGALRAIAPTTNGGAVIISEDGLIALDAADTVTDFAAGGGYRLAVHGDRIYVAALGAGVRIYTLHTGQLALAGHIATDQPAEDVAPDGADSLWVAAGSDGVRLYNVTDPARPGVITWLKTLTPAHVVRASGLHLLVSYADQAAMFDTIIIKAPHLIGSMPLGGSRTTFASDALFEQNEAIIGRVDVSGADVLHLSLSAASGLTTPLLYGTDGAGDRIARHGSDLFTGSERTGLRRLQLTTGGFSPIMAWPAATFSRCAPADYTPTQPTPANLSAVASAGTLTLRWTAVCPAVHYIVTVNGKAAGTVDNTAFDYVPAADQESISWQVAAKTDTGNISGADWTVVFERAGYTHSAAAPALTSVLYRPPRVLFDLSALQSPGWALAEVCVAGIGGVAIVIGGAWTIGAWAARRREM